MKNRNQTKIIKKPATYQISNQNQPKSNDFIYEMT